MLHIFLALIVQLLHGQTIPAAASDYPQGKRKTVLLKHASRPTFVVMCKNVTLIDLLYRYSCVASAPPETGHPSKSLPRERGKSFQADPYPFWYAKPSLGVDLPQYLGPSRVISLPQILEFRVASGVPSCGAFLPLYPSVLPPHLFQCNAFRRLSVRLCRGTLDSLEHAPLAHIVLMLLP
jgi:hypothetical protein